MTLLEPTPEALEAMRRWPDDGPVVMLNLLRFEPGGGARRYGEYARAFREILQDLGGRILFAGRAERLLVGEGEWHHVTLVEYPSRRAFADMWESPAYRAIHDHREAGLAKTVLYALQPIESIG